VVFRRFAKFRAFSSPGSISRGPNVAQDGRSCTQEVPIPSLCSRSSLSDLVVSGGQLSPAYIAISPAHQPKPARCERHVCDHVVVPKRTNTFQDVVAIVTRHMAGDALIEESVLVTPMRGGTPREVDVVVTSTVGGHHVVVGIEASKRSRPAPVGWIEEMMGKHDTLPTDKLVLYSGSGFTSGAVQKAEEYGILAVSGEPISDESLEDRVFSGLRSVWPKLIHLTPQQAKVWVTLLDGSEVWFKAVPDLRLFLEDGTSLPVALLEAVKAKINAQWEDVIKQVGLGDMTDSFDGRFVLGWRPFSAIVDGNEVRLYARNEDTDPPELHRIEAVQVTGIAVIDVERVELTHLKFGDVRVAYGEMSTRPAIVVASSSPEGDVISLRLKGPLDEP